MLKKILIIILLVLVVGFYFFPDSTKNIVDSTGDAIKETASDTFHNIKESDAVKDSVKSMKENITEEVGLSTDDDEETKDDK
jgi:hypothetical protein